MVPYNRTRRIYIGQVFTSKLPKLNHEAFPKLSVNIKFFKVLWKKDFSFVCFTKKPATVYIHLKAPSLAPLTPFLPPFSYPFLTLLPHLKNE